MDLRVRARIALATHGSHPGPWAARDVNHACRSHAFPPDTWISSLRNPEPSIRVKEFTRPDVGKSLPFWFVMAAIVPSKALPKPLPLLWRHLLPAFKHSLPMVKAWPVVAMKCPQKDAREDEEPHALPVGNDLHAKEGW